tara:strand:- start:83128 stop:83574 length:447 start_codon:yes stop_codon:yes gene_type:complete
MNRNAAQHYKEQQILNATPAERIVLLYNGAIKFLMHARVAVENKDIQERFNNNKRATEIINYLQETLDLEKGGEIGENLYRIYGYMLRRLIDVDMKNDMEAIDDVVGKLKELNASWQKIASGDVPLNVDVEKSEDEKTQASVTKSAIA